MTFHSLISTYSCVFSLLSYNPYDGPNEHPEAELPLVAGKYLYVYGVMDDDGFYEGEREITIFQLFLMLAVNESIIYTLHKNTYPFL